jgi:hypothetical protein
MEDNTEVKADVEKVGVSLRDSLESKFSAKDEADRVEATAVKTENDEESQEEEVTEETAPETSVQQTTPQLNQATQPKQERLAVAPPGDMSKEEKEAFLNPTAENSHILQSYLSRRAYQTQSDYSRKMNDLEQTRQKVTGLYNVIKDHESDYIRKGLNMADVTRRFIEWDKAMDANPTQTALEWLDAYEIDLNELVQMRQQGYAPQVEQPKYLTAADAERIAQEKIQAMMQQQQQSVLAETNYNTVQSFMNSKPLFKDPGTALQLEEAMAPVVAALSQQGGNPQDILETAYNYVTKGNPTFAALTQRLEAPTVVEQKVRQAEKAKAATKSISGGTGSGSPRLQVKDLRTNLQRRFNGGE